MHPNSRLDHLNETHMRVRRTWKFSAVPSSGKLPGVGKDARLSKLRMVEEPLPDSEDLYERPERRYRWYRPSLVG